VSLEAILLGLLALGIGLAFTFAGFKWFLILLPIWGFFAGFLFGANAVTYLFGDGFLVTVTSWVIGFVFAIAFALLSYLYYWFAIVLLGASLGYSLGLGVMAWLGMTTGILPFIVGIVVAIVVALAFIVLRVPKYVILIGTAFGGAFAAVAGVALILGRVPLAALNAGTVGAYISDELSWIWVAAALVLGAAGFAYQWMATARAEFIAYESYRNPGMPASS
jgi:hypothetical protein